MCNGWGKKHSPLLPIFFPVDIMFFEAEANALSLSRSLFGSIELKFIISIHNFDRMIWIYFEMVLITLKSFQTHNIGFYFHNHTDIHLCSQTYFYCSILNSECSKQMI